MRRTKDRSTTTVTVGRDYRIVLPASVSKSLRLKPGQQLEFLSLDGIITLVPPRSPKEMRGFFKGIDSTVPRDPDRILP
ncbi:MAG: AbrB/MazE/SpoVT family DNA-binding domain-containing protein [Candidatus Hydrogenedentes bacterium]|nr:AbrB/MazE/SpoVT family DNA-binding domain-containing protein [Candidatus Hydrogenedentota bacterium]